MAAPNVQIVEYQPVFGEYVAAHIRPMDRREIYYLSLVSPEAAIRCSSAHAVASWAALVDGVPAAVFGISRATRVSEIASPWMMATPVADRLPRAVAMHSLIYFSRFCRAFPRMENHVLAENIKVVRWLRWLGFDMDEPAPYGAFGAPFIRFGKGLR